MKRLACSDSVGGFISMCPDTEEHIHSPGSNHMYSREYQSMLDGLDEEGCLEESGHITEKKRRLSMDQVRALEKTFEIENKLEPERKVKLAHDLGLQPRQVAVWFQNRRARWKTKQLERDYGVLKASYDSLKQNYESLQHDKDSLLKEIKELNSKLNRENTESNTCVKKEALMSDSDNNSKGVEPITPPSSLSGGSESEDSKLVNTDKGMVDFKDGPSESDSSAILNEDNNSPNASNSSCEGGRFLQNTQQLLLMSPNSPSLRLNCSTSSPSSINCFSFTNPSAHNPDNNAYHPQFVKLEEHDFLSGEEACNFFSDEAAPTLHWYCPEQWS